MQAHLLDNSLIASVLFSPGPAERFLILQLDDRLLDGPARWAFVVAKGLIREGRASNLTEMKNRVDDPVFHAFLVKCSDLEPVPIRLLKERLEWRFRAQGNAIPVSDYEWTLQAVEDGFREGKHLVDLPESRHESPNQMGFLCSKADNL